MESPNREAQRPNRRRRYLINPAFQWKQACTIAVIVFLTSSIVSFATFGVLHQQARMRVSNPTGYDADVRSVILLFSVGCSALTAGGIGFWSILMTHRICGPAYVLERCMRELRAGRFPRMRGLRRKDEFQTLYAAAQGAVEVLEARMRSEIAAVGAAVDLARSAQEASEAVRQSSLQTLTCQLELLRRELAEWLQQDQQTDVSMPAREALAVPARENAAAKA